MMLVYVSNVVCAQRNRAWVAIEFVAFTVSSRPGVARRLLTFLLLRQKQSKQKKRRPYCLRPFAVATGIFRCSVQPGPRSNSLRSENRGSLPVWPSAPQRIQKGFLGKYKITTGSPTPRCHCGRDPQSMNPHRRAQAAGDGSRIKSGMTNREKVGPVPDCEFLPQTRPGWAEERSRKRIKSLDVRRRRSRLVSKISVFCEHRKLPEGTQTAGRLFFGYFLLAKQKKVTSRRAPPGLVVKGTNPRTGEQK